MKKILLLVLSVSALGNLFAQQTKSDQLFNQPDSYTNRRFYIDLDKGNKMQVSVTNLDDLNHFRNMDSLIYAFLQDMKLLKDSLGDELTSRRVDYLVDDSSQHRIRIQRFHTAGTSFLINQSGPAALKTEQDTIIFLGKVDFIAKYPMRKGFQTTRYYKLSFYVNDLSDLARYMNGTLNKKIGTIQEHAGAHWTVKGYSNARLDADTSIHARANKGYVAGGDFINLNAAVALQNYKQYFVPSFNIGVNLVFAGRNFKRQVGVYWEPHFLFARDAAGQLKTYRNDFITLVLSQGFIKDNDPRKPSPVLTTFSIGYLTNKNRKGDYFDKHTIRLGVGSLSLFEGKTNLEPVMYFTDLFKHVTPGLRLIHHF